LFGYIQIQLIFFATFVNKTLHSIGSLMNKQSIIIASIYHE